MTSLKSGSISSLYRLRSYTWPRTHHNITRGTLFLLVLGIMDLATTLLGLSSGIAREANPVAYLLPLTLIQSIIAMKVATYIVLGLWYFYYLYVNQKWFAKTFQYCLYFLIGLYVLVVTNNLTVLIIGALHG